MSPYQGSLGTDSVSWKWGGGADPLTRLKLQNHLEKIMKKTKVLLTSTQMKIDGNSLAIRGKYIHSTISGWTMIPNVKFFAVKMQEWDSRWQEAMNIKVRVKPGKFEYEKNKNDKYNKYIKYQVRRLGKAKSDPNKYWAIALKLIERSVSFRMSAWIKVKPHWFMDMSVNRVRYVNNCVSKFVRNELFNMSHKRVYIPKGDTVRPLGVPTLAWRIYLHMWSNMLEQFYHDSFLKSQHGFIKKRGTLTAWIDIFTNCVKKPWIYECDLQQFFPSVMFSVIKRRMWNLGTPDYVAQWLEKLCCSIPQLPKEKLLDESLVEKKKGIGFLDTVEGNMKAYIHLMSETIENFNPKVVQMKSGPLTEAVFKMFKSKTSTQLLSTFGVPQGSPVSPILSMLGLYDFLSQQQSLSYADDPIFYGMKKFFIEDHKYAGLKVNPAKSFWVKKNNVWLRNLKYLGLEFDPINNTISTAVRNKGKPILIITMDNVIQILKAFKVKNITLDTKSFNNWRLLFANRKIGGLVLNRLYAGKWERDLYQVEYVKVKRNSLIQRKRLSTHNMTLLSSDAAVHLREVLESKHTIRYYYPINKVEIGSEVHKSNSKLLEWDHDEYSFLKS